MKLKLLTYYVDYQHDDKIIILFQQTLITKEDGPLETCQAVLYFISSCILFYLFINSKSENKIYLLRRKRNLWFLFLGLICLFATGEEISWGQRIFNIETPYYFLNHNEQDEINIHNLQLFQAKENGEWKRGIQYLLNGQYIAYYFFIFFLILIPLGNKFSKKAHKLIEKIYFPVTPFWIGVLFILATIKCEIIKRNGLIGYFQIGEIKETVYASLLFIAIISLLNQHRIKYMRSTQ